MARKFERVLEKTTSATLLEPDWEGILTCVDLLRSGEAPLAPAVLALRKRAHNDNPHVATYALLVLEAAMKNCGDKFHKEVATKDMMEDLKHLAADTTIEKTVRDKVLELISCWSHAFRNKSEYKIIVDTHNLMKLEAIRESEAMFVAESAPEWADGPNCFRCRAEFGLITRKHHCRNCGQIFCDKCSSRQLLLPHIGIEKEVRVCEACFEKLAAPAERKAAAATEQRSGSRPSPAPGPPTNGALSEEEKRRREEDARKREEEDIQLAMAISQSEAEEQERQKAAQLSALYNGSSNAAPETRPGLSYKGTRSSSEPETDPELARYLDRGYWEEKQRQSNKVQATGAERKSPTPSAPPSAQPMANGHGTQPSNGTLNEQLQQTPPPVASGDTKAFADALRQQVDVFVNRIRSNQARGRSIINDTGINNLFISLTSSHADVLNRIHSLEDRRGRLEGLQDQLSHIQEARAALTALREETERERAQERMDEQRRRQVLMQGKLEMMRVKKHEMLESQRLATLAQMQTHQTELQLRRQLAALGLHQPPPGTPIIYVPGPDGNMMPTFASQMQQMPQYQQQQQMPPQQIPNGGAEMGAGGGQAMMYGYQAAYQSGPGQQPVPMQQPPQYQTQAPNTGSMYQPPPGAYYQHPGTPVAETNTVAANGSVYHTPQGPNPTPYTGQANPNPQPPSYTQSAAAQPPATYSAPQAPQSYTAPPPAPPPSYSQATQPPQHPQQHPQQHHQQPPQQQAQPQQAQPQPPPQAQQYQPQQMAQVPQPIPQQPPQQVHQQPPVAAGGEPAVDNLINFD